MAPLGDAAIAMLTAADAPVKSSIPRISLSTRELRLAGEGAEEPRVETIEGGRGLGRFQVGGAGGLHGGVGVEVGGDTGEGLERGVRDEDPNGGVGFWCGGDGFFVHVDFGEDPDMGEAAGV